MQEGMCHWKICPMTMSWLEEANSTEGAILLLDEVLTQFVVLIWGGAQASFTSILLIKLTDNGRRFGMHDPKVETLFTKLRIPML